jgi:hypothetical protein
MDLRERLVNLVKSRRKPHPGQTSLFGQQELPMKPKPKRPKPPAGFMPVKGSKKGGYFKMQGGKRVYWYPDTGHAAGSHEAPTMSEEKIAVQDEWATKFEEKAAAVRASGGSETTARAYLKAAKMARDGNIPAARRWAESVDNAQRHEAPSGVHGAFMSLKPGQAVTIRSGGLILNGAMVTNAHHNIGGERDYTGAPVQIKMGEKVYWVQSDGKGGVILKDPLSAKTRKVDSIKAVAAPPKPEFLGPGFQQDPGDPRGGWSKTYPGGDIAYEHSPKVFEGKPPTEIERKKMYAAQALMLFEEEASIALAEGRGVRYSLDKLPPRERAYAEKLIAAHKELGIDSPREKARWRSLSFAYEKFADPEKGYLPKEHWAKEEAWLAPDPQAAPPKPMTIGELGPRAVTGQALIQPGLWASTSLRTSRQGIENEANLAAKYLDAAHKVLFDHHTPENDAEAKIVNRAANAAVDASGDARVLASKAKGTGGPIGMNLSELVRSWAPKIQRAFDLIERAKRAAEPETRRLYASWNSAAKASLERAGEHRDGTLANEAWKEAAHKQQYLADHYGSGSADSAQRLDAEAELARKNAEREQTKADKRRARAKSKAKKSLGERIHDKLEKAAPNLSGALPKGGKPIPKGAKFGAGGAAKPKPSGPVQGSVVKPPAGFTPIPHSKKGGYHKQIGGGKYIYWYPGQGIVNDKHEADAESTPHQEATAKHVMDQIAALEKKGKVSKEELEHTQTAIRNAWPKGPQDVPRHIMDHYHKLQSMVTGEAAAEGEQPAGKEGKDLPEVKVKRPGKPPASVKELEAEKDAAAKDRATKKEAAAQKKDEKRKAARAKVLTDYKKVPENFNKMPKMERAKLTANWDQVKEDLDAKYSRADYMAHPDMAQAITEHIDELAELGHIVPANTGRAKGMILTQLKYGEQAGIKKEQLAAILEENVRKLAHQEVESVKRTLGDHGVRHLEVNAHQANRIFDQLEAAGIKVSAMDRFMSGQVMIDHDMGYTIPVIAKGGFKIKDNYHPQASAVLAKQQAAKYKKVFGAKAFKEYLRHVETHSGSNVDWKKDPVGSAVRLADNTHLFADKLPEVLFDTNAGVEVLTKIKLADQVVPKSLETVDDKGNPKKERTPEEKAEFKALIGGIKDQLAQAIKTRKDLPESTKKLLANAVNEIGALTPKFLVSRLAGREPQFQYDKASGDMKVNIEQSPAREAIGQIFGDDETDKQFVKMLEDFGTAPDKAFGKAPPPQAQVRVGSEGNGIDFAWTAPKGEHPTERRYAKVMKDTKARLNEIQAMKGGARKAAIKKFFGAELAKAMEAVVNAWALADGLEELEKSAMSAMAARTGRVRPSGAYKPSMEAPKMGIKDRISSAMGRHPGGAGWSKVPGGKKGGYRKMVGGKWVYWYPGMGSQGGSEKQAEAHQAKQKAKKEIAQHEKKADKWQKKYSKRLDQGRHQDAKAALEQRHHHSTQAERLRAQHGVEKALEEDETMKPDKGEDKLSKPTETAKSVLVNRCQVHLGPDEALAKSIEDGDLGIGTVPRHASSKSGRRLSKAVGGEGVTERGGDQREATARAQQDDQVVRMDPAGNCGNGGLPDWFSDAQKTQEPMVRAPAVMSKAQEPPTRVIDDSDPYTRRLHRADPRDAAQADISFLFNRDAKRTE